MVAIALGIGAVVLVGLQRDALRDGIESSAEDRASALADQIEADGLPDSLGEDDDEDDEDVVVQVTDESGSVVLGDQDLPDEGYLTVSEDADSGGEEYDVRVAASLEDVEESTAALVPLLLVGVPLLLVVVGGTTWAVVTRALSPVERIRKEVETIGDERLDRRVPVPGARDEIHRLATTMNAMLSRLEGSRRRQQRFVSDSSHELRSPLASLRQSAEVARAHPEALPEGELADVVFEETVRMQRLVDQMLLLTRTDEGDIGDRRREVDLDDLARTEAGRLRNGLVIDASRVGRRAGPRRRARARPGGAQPAGQRRPARARAGRGGGAPGRVPGGAHRGRRRHRYPGGPAGAGLRAVRSTRRGPQPRCRWQRPRTGDRARDRPRPRR